MQTDTNNTWVKCQRKWKSEIKMNETFKGYLGVKAGINRCHYVPSDFKPVVITLHQRAISKRFALLCFIEDPVQRTTFQLN